MNPGRDVVIIIAIIIALSVVSTLVKSSGSGSLGLGVYIFEDNFLPPAPQPTVGQSEVEEYNNLTEEEQRKIIEEEILKIQAEIVIVEEELSNIEKYGEPSPYVGMITIRKNYGTMHTADVDKEYIQLDASSNNTKSITITGWKLKSSITGRTVSIPEAVHLIFTGSSGSKLPINLVPGDIAYITTGRSPIGLSFLVNKCTGYYTQFQIFTPYIRNLCPDPEDEIRYYSRDTSIFIDNACMDFVERISSCSIPTNALPSALSYICQEAIIEEINYGSCVEKHKDDADFRVPDWRIYLERDSELWREKRELIKLIDENGKTVDYYSY